MSRLLDIAQTSLLLLDPETAHEASLRAIETGLSPRSNSPNDERLGQTVAGLHFPNPVGIAAGYDKDARVFNQLLRMGFGFVEVGTVTPLPQPGNAKPRVFRMMRERAVINRLGFNSGGHDAAMLRLAATPFAGVVGVNIGANKETGDVIEDYRRGVRAFASIARYITVNISSPNTPGLRDLQAPERLDHLLEAVIDERDAAKKHVPIFVKLAPDIHDDDIDKTAAMLLARRVDGVIVSNTTLARTGVPSSAHRGEAGGLSGRPLFRRSTRMLARFYLQTAGKIPLIGVGGIDGGQAAIAKIKAGASLIQLYTGLIYEGAGLLGRIEKALVAEVEKTGSPLSELRGLDATTWAEAAL